MQQTLTLNWENCDFAFEGEEEVKTTADSESRLHSKQIQDENEQKKIIQLQKFKDPNKDGHRKAYIASASRFIDLILKSNRYKDFEGLLTSDFEAFLFNFAETKPVLFTSKPQDLLGLYKGIQVLKRQVKEAYVDVECATAIQICYCETKIDSDQEIIPQFSFETFSFKGDKISKYRALFGSSNSFNEFHHPFAQTSKDLMLARVKELNIAWAGQPNLEKIASLLHPTTEYKIWSWEDHKVLIFYKENFVSGFKSMEENYELKCVVPYDAFSEGQFIMGNYVYYLEGKHQLAGKKYFWLSTCIYTFDKNLNIVKINQQGELYPENEVEVPFAVNSREKIKKDIMDFYTKEDVLQKDWYTLGTENFMFTVELTRFCPKHLFTIDHVNGFKEFEKFSTMFESKHRRSKWRKPIDFYVDHHDASYDVLILIQCLGGPDKMDDSGTDLNYFCMKKMCIENGKVAKSSVFFSEVPEPIPSPYDDKTFTTENIKCKEDFFI